MSPCFLTPWGQRLRSELRSDRCGSTCSNMWTSHLSGSRWSAPGGPYVCLSHQRQWRTQLLKAAVDAPGCVTLNTPLTVCSVWELCRHSLSGHGHGCWASPAFWRVILWLRGECRSVVKSISYGNHAWVYISAPPLEVKSFCHSCLHHLHVRKRNIKPLGAAELREHEVHV